MPTPPPPLPLLLPPVAPPAAELDDRSGPRATAWATSGLSMLSSGQTGVV
jgi:hypothetical protein